MEKYICGIDENGFGPVLGPLVITGILTSEDIKIPDYIKDSKIFYKNKKDLKKIEEIAVISFYMVENRTPSSPYEIFKRFSYKKCAFEENLCEKNIPLFFESENIKEIIKRYSDLLKEKDKIKRIEVKTVCPYFFNDFVKKKKSKFLLNLFNFCEIIKEMENYKNIKFFCGKIGGTIYYRNFLKYFLPDYEIYALKETDDFSEYKISKKNLSFELGFYKNVENISPVASFSSIIGKYMREIIMKSIIKSLNMDEDISGYRDRKTKKFIEKINFSKFRKECIIRIS
ncbi:MAG TPA: hypothetical protein PKV21_00315 [bacterium]|nr:hypothetical protein [bacterium]HOM25937.1 hypothetical protein [bacterium]